MTNDIPTGAVSTDLPIALGKFQTAGSEDGRRPLLQQVGGNHYKKLKIQPVEYVHANGIGYFEGTAIKYLSRWKDKGGLEDLRKAIHFIELLIELETKDAT